MQTNFKFSRLIKNYLGNIMTELNFINIVYRVLNIKYNILLYTVKYLSKCSKLVSYIYKVLTVRSKTNMQIKKFKLQTDFEFNRLTKSYLADVYEKIIPQIQYQIISVKQEKKYVLEKFVKKI